MFDDGPRPTEIVLGVGDLVLFHGRLGTVTRLGPRDRIVWIEVTDNGGLTRLFSTFATNAVQPLSMDEYDVLDSLTAATAEPRSEHGREARRAELFFADPQVGDVFYIPGGSAYLSVQELGEDGSVRVVTKSCRESTLSCHTDSIYFASVELFRRNYQFKTRPGYSLLAFSSLRSDEKDPTPMPTLQGEWR